MKTRRCLGEEGYMYPNLDCGESVNVTRVCCWPSAWSGVILEKLIPAFDGTRMFITMLTRSRHFYVSWARWIQSTSSQSVSLRSTFVLSSHVMYVYVTSLLQGFPTKILYVFIFSPIRVICPSHLSFLIWVPQCWEVPIIVLLIMYFSPSRIGPNILFLTRARISDWFTSSNQKKDFF